MMPEVLPSDDLFEALFDLSLTGSILYAPILDAAGEVVDFTYLRLNPAAQRMLGLAAQPASSMLTRFPGARAVGILDLYRQAFATGATQRGEFNYQLAGLDTYYLLVAQRVGQQLLVSFTDTSEQPRTAVEQTLRESQAREQAARQEAEAQRQRLQQVLMQLPTNVALFQGPDHVYELLNERYQQLFPQRVMRGQPLREALPEAIGQGFAAVISQVYQSGQPSYLPEIAAQADFAGNGQLEQRYYNASFQPLANAQGQVTDVLNVAFDITEQVLARQRVEQLNQELEARVAERTQEAHAARAEAERQQGELARVFEQAPVAIGVYRGPQYRIELANDLLLAMWQRPLAEVLGQPLLAVFPELAGQGFVQLLDQVLATGQPYVAQDAAATLRRGDVVSEGFFNFVYTPLREADGRIGGVVVVITETTEQVLARRQADTLQQAMLAAAQRQARQREELFQIFAQTPVAIVLLREPDHRIDYFNPAFEELFPPEQWVGGPLRGHTLAQVYPRIREVGLVALLDAVYQTGESQAVLDMPLAELYPGSPRYVSFAYQAYREEGRIVGVAAFVYDTTEQVLAQRQADTMRTAMLAAAQRQARQREELYQVFEQAPAAIVLLREPNHRIEYVNPTYQQLFPGLSLRGRLIQEAHPSVLTDGTLARLDQVYQTGRPYVGEEYAVSLTLVPGQPAQTHYFNFIYQPYREAGATVGVSLFAYDVTEGVLARRAATQELERQQGELQRVFEQAPVAITILRGSSLVIELANAAMSRIWGRQPAQLLGRPHFEAMPETVGQGFEELLLNVLHTGQPLAITEAPARLARGPADQPEQAYVNFVFQPLLNEQGIPTGLIAIGTEVTEQVLARQRVEQLNQELEARVAERTQEAHAAQAAAERERTQLQALLTQAPVAIALFQGPDTRIVSANARMAAFWGRTPEQVVGRPLLEAMPELAGQGFNTMIQEVAATRVPFVGTEAPAVIRQDGELVTRYYNFICQPIYDAEGGLLGVLNVATEVTEQVRARREVEQLNQELETRVADRTRELAEQQVLLRQILGQVPAYIATLSGPEHRYSFFNELYQKLAAGRAVLGHHVAELVPELAEQGFVRLLDEVYRTGQPYIGTDVPVRLSQASGGEARLYYLDFIYQPLFDGQQQVQGILAFILDVTDRTLARQQAERSRQQILALNHELTATNAGLFESEERFRIMADAAPNIIWALNPDGSVRYVNKYCLEFLGIPLAQFVADNWTPYLLPDDVAVTEQTVAQAIGSRTLFSMEHRMRRHDGQYRWLRTQGNPSYYPNGELFGYVGSAIDITELKEANQQLQRTNDDLDTFVYTASHDLKAPITNIEGLLDALRDYLPGTADADGKPAEPMIPHLLKLMADSVARFQQTINQLTDVSRLQNAAQEPAEPVALAPLIEDIRLDLTPLLTSSHGQLLVEVTACPMVLFSPKNLRSILYNLLSNALKYASPDRPPVVRVRASCPPGQVRLDVHDNGLGLSEAQQAKLFTLFQRLHTHVEGTGVGLYMLKRIIENAGGRILVQSEPGVGTTFTVLLPHSA